MVSFEMSDLKKIGRGLTGFGIIFTLIGVLLFFDKSFLAIGNILLVSGVILTVGPKSSLQFFINPQNLKGSVSFGVGFFFVVTGWPIVGLIVETYGLIVFVSGFWHMIPIFLKNLPILRMFHQTHTPSYTPSYLRRQRGERRVPV